MYLALFINALLCVLAFYKSNAKDLNIPIIKDFTPTMWWLTLSFINNYYGLTSWWKISATPEAGGLGVVKATIVTGVIALVIDVLLLCVHYKIEVKYIVALVLVGIAGYIVK